MDSSFSLQALSAVRISRRCSWQLLTEWQSSGTRTLVVPLMCYFLLESALRNGEEWPPPEDVPTSEGFGFWFGFFFLFFCRLASGSLSQRASQTVGQSASTLPRRMRWITLKHRVCKLTPAPRNPLVRTKPGCFPRLEGL